MSDLTLRDPAKFGTDLLKVALELGFQSLTKRDLELLIFFLLERDGAIGREETNFDVGRRLRLTPARVRSLRREAYARWRPLLEEDRGAALRRICASTLTERNIEAGAQHASERTRKDGFLAVRLEHADDQLQLEQAILDVGAIPIFERNREVLVVRFDTLVAIAEKWQFLPADTGAALKKLKALAPTAEELESLLQKDVKDIRWDEVRTAINKLGAKAITGLTETKVTDVLKLVFPFLGSAGK